MKSFSVIKAAEIFIIFSLFGSLSNAQIYQDEWVYGVTLDAVNNINAITTALGSHSQKTTARIVFDEFVPASEYLTPAYRIHKVSYIMGEILDSYYMHLYTVQQYIQRTHDYLDTLGDRVDIWEIGNEINGEWLGNNADVVLKMTQAYGIVKSRHKKAALTLYYNWNCWENPQNEMFRWTLNNIPQNMKDSLDYVFVSYYEDDCNNYQPNWQKVFDSLHVVFPHSKLGIGECGTSYANRKEIYINRYYRMRIATPNYIGGYFWWYYKQDCVPMTNYLWSVMDAAMCNYSFTDGDNKSGIEFYNYPNPFNPVTMIKYIVKTSSQINITIYDITGREVSVLVKEERQPGSYDVKFDGSDLASGVYYYSLQSGDYREVKKMVLMK